MEDNNNEELLNSILSESSSEEGPSENTSGGGNDGASLSDFFSTDDIPEEVKIVSQLDKVTKDTEKKATEVFDIMSSVSENAFWAKENINEVDELLKEVTEEIGKIDVPAIHEKLEKINNSISDSKEILNHVNDILIEAMSLMQYQDINRQKIERVINVMRALIKYLNILFEGSQSDKERTSSATMIIGDSDLDLEMQSTDDIDKLIDIFNS
ncbi:chemotaxis protein [bacterium]|jgi:chemotaxis regulatin CheY-phosphate phosphatase CheZ|nr:chemotaxis protein [bacterium]